MPIECGAAVTYAYDLIVHDGVCALTIGWSVTDATMGIAKIAIIKIAIVLFLGFCIFFFLSYFFYRAKGHLLVGKSSVLPLLDGLPP
jgi:hypothetical protein